MAPSLTLVIYKHDSGEEFAIIVNPDEYKKWKEGDKTIPLIDVVDSYNVFHFAQGKLLKPSQQQLDTVFETHNDDDVVTRILEEGKLQNSGTITSAATFNISRGSLDSHSKGLSGI